MHNRSRLPALSCAPTAILLVASVLTGCQQNGQSTAIAADDAHRSNEALPLDYNAIRRSLASIDVEKCVTDLQGDSLVELTLGVDGAAFISRVDSTSLGHDAECLKRVVRFRITRMPSSPVVLQVVVSAREPGFGVVRYKERAVLWLRTDAEARDSGLKPPFLHVEKL